MRKLKLQMQITVDGFVAGPQGQLAWMTTEAGVSSLIEAGLIDELNFFVNPVAIGQGMRVFQGDRPLKLISSTAYPSGIVVNSYQPR